SREGAGQPDTSLQAKRNRYTSAGRPAVRMKAPGLFFVSTLSSCRTRDLRSGKVVSMENKGAFGYCFRHVGLVQDLCARLQANFCVVWISGCLYDKVRS